MDKILILVVILFASGNAFATGCKPVLAAFSQYQQSLISGKSITQYFSHRVLADQLDSIFVADDEIIIHNAKATAIQLRPKSLLVTPSTVASSCNAKSAKVTASFRDGKTKEIVLKYIIENGMWHSDGIEVSIRTNSSGI